MLQMLTTMGFAAKGESYGATLNKIMFYSPYEWVMIHDHDIFLCHPEWYRLITENIEKAENPGLLTCVTNRIGNSEQKSNYAGIGNSNNLTLHRQYAIDVEERDLIKANKPISGLVMVTSKKAWKEAGGFRESGIIGVDNDYHRRIEKAGFESYIMSNVYVYHWYRQPIEGYNETD